MSDLPIPAPLSAEDARSLTDEVKADAAALWQKLLTLYEHGAHTALGYTSWGAYFKAEFGQSGRRGYQLLKAARVVEALPSERPFTEWTAREIAAVPEPERAEVWQAATERAATEERPVTAADVRHVRMLGTPPAPEDSAEAIVAEAAEADLHIRRVKAMHLFTTATAAVAALWPKEEAVVDALAHNGNPRYIDSLERSIGHLERIRDRLRPQGLRRVK